MDRSRGSQSWMRWPRGLSQDHGKGSVEGSRRSCSRRWGGALLALFIGVTPMLTPIPARALLSTATGEVSVTGFATLPSFPCSGICGDGSFSGTAVAQLAGLDLNGNPFVATWSLATLTSSITYTDSCPELLPVLPPSGAGGGHFALSGGHFVVGGTGDPATFTGGLIWVRYGTVATVTVNGKVVSGARGVVSNQTNVAQGAATFVPIPRLGGTTPNCATPSGTLTAEVTAVDIQVI
jgi:hypothetical protein